MEVGSGVLHLGCGLSLLFVPVIIPVWHTGGFCVPEAIRNISIKIVKANQTCIGEKRVGTDQASAIAAGDGA
jgi:hypothetical protein